MADFSRIIAKFQGLDNTKAAYLRDACGEDYQYKIDANANQQGTPYPDVLGLTKEQYAQDKLWELISRTVKNKIKSQQDAENEGPDI